MTTSNTFKSLFILLSLIIISLSANAQNNTSELLPDRLKFDDLPTFNEASIRYLSGQLFIQNATDNFGIQIIADKQIWLQNSAPLGRFVMNEDGSLQAGLGLNSFGQMSKFDIYHPSSSSSPHLNLIEREATAPARLRFSNDNDLLHHWTIAARIVPNDYKLTFALNSQTRLQYVENDSLWKFTGDLQATAGKLVLEPNGFQDGSQIFLKDENGDDKIKLVSHQSSTVDGGWIGMFNSLNNRTVRIQADDDQNAGRIHLATSDGTENLKLDADWNGTGFARVVAHELELNGGSDFAENFDIIPTEGNSILPGMVVSIDPQRTGKLKLSTSSYDNKVAGIVSGANGIRTGMMMGQKGSIADGEYPVALTGRVYVYANKSNGEINPGDLLTTSETPGQAMKASDQNKSFGAIIGKAMTNITEDGYVLVLVNLQ